MSSNSEFLEFVKGLSSLSPAHILTLLVLQRMEGQRVYLMDIGEAVGVCEVTVRHYLRSLQRQGHLIYVVREQGKDEPCHEICWVRRAIAEKTPAKGPLIYRRTKVELTHPDHGEVVVAHGKLRAFAREHNLNYRAFRQILNGYRKSYKKWRLK
jgi:hypothetical protein